MTVMANQTVLPTLQGRIEEFRTQLWPDVLPDAGPLLLRLSEDRSLSQMVASLDVVFDIQTSRSGLSYVLNGLTADLEPAAA